MDRLISSRRTKVQPYAMDDDRIVGDGGGVTLYERPDGSRYALDARGRGYELCFGEGAIGPGPLRRAAPRRRPLAGLALVPRLGAA